MSIIRDEVKRTIWVAAKMLRAENKEIDLVMSEMERIDTHFRACSKGCPDNDPEYQKLQRALCWIIKETSYEDNIKELILGPKDQVGKKLRRIRRQQPA